MKTEDKFAVSMASYLCPCCLKEDNVILMNQKLTKKEAEKVKQAHGACLGFGDVCSDCQKLVDDGFIALVPLNQEKYKEGFIELLTKPLWVKKHIAEDMFKQTIKTPLVHVDKELIDYLVSEYQKQHGELPAEQGNEK